MALAPHLRAGARRYGALLSLPGARAPVVAAAIGCMPIGMYGLGILLLARDASGSFAEAGRVVGAFGLANAIGAVAQGRLMDRLGQPGVLRVAAVAHAATLGALVVAAAEDAPAWVLALCAAGGGASLPQAPAAMRSVWGALVEDEEQRQTAYALVSIMFEVAVVTAPVLVALLVALASPSAAVLVAAAMCAGGGLGFAATARLAALARRAPRGRLARPALGPGDRPSSRCSARSGSRSASCRSRCRRSPTSAGTRPPAGSSSRRCRRGAWPGGSSTARARGRARPPCGSRR